MYFRSILGISGLEVEWHKKHSALPFNQRWRWTWHPMKFFHKDVTSISENSTFCKPVQLVLHCSMVAFCSHLKMFIRCKMTENYCSHSLLNSDSEEFGKRLDRSLCVSPFLLTESRPFHLLKEIINTSLTALAVGQNRCKAMKTWCTWAQFYTFSYHRDLQCPKCPPLFCQSPVLSVKCCDERDQRDSPHPHLPVESVCPCPAQQRRGACCTDTLHTDLVSKAVRIQCHLRHAIKHIWSLKQDRIFPFFLCYMVF